MMSATASSDAVSVSIRMVRRIGVELSCVGISGYSWIGASIFQLFSNRLIVTQQISQEAVRHERIFWSPFYTSVVMLVQQQSL
jgi:hypothetical protein